MRTDIRSLLVSSFRRVSYCCNGSSESPNLILFGDNMTKEWKVTYKKTAGSAEHWKYFESEQKAKVFAGVLGDRLISIKKTGS